MLLAEYLGRPGLGHLRLRGQGSRADGVVTCVEARYGAQDGSVTDIYLPKWFAHNMPAIHTPLLVLMTYLHARNLWRHRYRSLAAAHHQRA